LVIDNPANINIGQAFPRPFLGFVFVHLHSRAVSAKSQICDFPCIAMVSDTIRA
jgi:hypothetical protein